MKQKFSKNFARLALVLLVAVLAACGGREIKRVNPPQVSIQKLELQSGRHIVMDLRVHNHSDVPMRIAGLDLGLQLASREATRIELSPDINVSPHTAELVSFRFQPGDDIAAAFERALQSGITYRLRGEVRSSEPRRTDTVEFDGRLNPVPGKPGEFR